MSLFTYDFRFMYRFLNLMQKYVLMMTRAVIIFKNTCLILELEKSEGLQNEDFLSILKMSEITKILQKHIKSKSIQSRQKVKMNLNVIFSDF